MVSRIVYVVDDDEHVRQSLGFVLQTAGFEPRLFESGQAFLVECESRPHGCVLLDVRMPGVDGMTCLDQLVAKGLPSPILMMTGHGDVPMAVKAIKSGAFDFLEKPFNDVQMIGLLHKAFGMLEQRVALAEGKHQAKAKVATLTKREHDVLQGLVDGLNNKLLARNLDLGVRTIETYRASMMQKLQAGSVSEALQIANLAGFKSAVSGGRPAGT